MDTTSNSVYGHIPKLTTKNYGVWSIRAEAVLWKAGLWDLVSAPLSASAPSSSSATGDASTPKEDVDRRQREAAYILVLITSDEVLKMLTITERSQGQKMWHRLATLFHRTGIQQYIMLQRQHHALRHDPEIETLDEFLTKEKKLQDDMDATGVTVTDDLRQVIFLMSSMPSKYSTTIQL
jgi:gag-polypeptide of LTR copia-type